ARLRRLERKHAIVLGYGEEALGWQPLATPIAVEVASDLIGLVEGATEGSLSGALGAALRAMRVRILERYGGTIPGIRFRGNEGDLPWGSYIVLLNEVPLLSGQAHSDLRFVPRSVEHSANTAGRPPHGDAHANGAITGSDPLTGEDGEWLDPEQA